MVTEVYRNGKGIGSCYLGLPSIWGLGIQGLVFMLGCIGSYRLLWGLYVLGL